jgi:hypothetical protein
LLLTAPILSARLTPDDRIEIFEEGEEVGRDLSGREREMLWERLSERGEEEDEEIGDE